MAEYLTGSQRTILVKVLAYLGLVRWYNLLLVALAQYLAAIFVLNDHLTVWQVLRDPGLHLLIFSCGLIIAGGYLVNAFYDLEKDMVNRPRHLIIGRIISKQFALNTYLAFTMSGVLLGWLVGFRIMLFYSGFAFLLWFYSHKLKKITFIGNLAATFLSVCSFFVICVYYWQVNWTIVLYVLFIILLELVREIIKDLEAIKGDIIFGYSTVPVALGINRTKQLLYGLMLVGFIPVAAIYPKINGALIIFYGLAVMLMSVAAIMLKNASVKKDFAAINSLLKVIIVLGVLSLGML